MNIDPPCGSAGLHRALVAAAIDHLTDIQRAPTVCRIQAAVREHDGIELSFIEIIEARKPQPAR